MGAEKGVTIEERGPPRPETKPGGIYSPGSLKNVLENELHPPRTPLLEGWSSHVLGCPAVPDRRGNTGERRCVRRRTGGGTSQPCGPVPCGTVMSSVGEVRGREAQRTPAAVARRLRGPRAPRRHDPSSLKNPAGPFCWLLCRPCVAGALTGRDASRPAQRCYGWRVAGPAPRPRRSPARAPVPAQGRARPQ